MATTGPGGGPGGTSTSSTALPPTQRVIATHELGDLGHGVHADSAHEPRLGGVGDGHDDVPHAGEGCCAHERQHAGHGSHRAVEPDLTDVHDVGDDARP